MAHERKTPALKGTLLTRALKKNERVWLKSEDLPNFSDYYVDNGMIDKIWNNENHLIVG
jgi:hypothetical protein